MRKRIAGVVLSSIVVSTFVTAWAQTVQINGKVTLKQADGSVTVNDQAMSQSSEISSGSTVKTQQNSSAVVSLGKLGRVEIMESTAVRLDYGNTGATAMLSQGRVRLSTSTGVTVKTDSAEITSNRKGTSHFTVDVVCGDTLVIVQTGHVELRAGNTVKQIAAGGQDTAGQARPGCRR